MAFDSHLCVRAFGTTYMFHLDIPHYIKIIASEVAKSLPLVV